MVIKAKRPIEILSKENREFAKQLEKRIDRCLKKRMKALKVGGSVFIDIVPLGDPRFSHMVKLGLIDKYQRAGWNISVKHMVDESKETSDAKKPCTALKVVFEFQITSVYC